MKDNGYKILAGFLVGALGGLLTGIMVAPESGKKTRERLLEEANHLKDDLLAKAEEQFEVTKKRLTEKIVELSEAGKKSVNDLKEKIG